MSAELPPPLAALAAVWSALLGAAVGSFLNVVVARLPAGESVVRPRSRCPRCGTPIRGRDNVPLVSWFLLRGRCRACGGRISARYPLVEALGAALALVAFARHGLSWAGGCELIFAAALLALALIDLDTWLLPHAITWPLAGAGLLASAAGWTAAGSLRASAWGAGVGFAAFAAVSRLGEKVLKREALGFGDVWLLAGIGAWLGIAALLPVVLLASLQGSIVGVALVALGKGQPGPPDPAGADAPPPGAPRQDTEWVPPRNAVPFGPFLVAGALEWLWAGKLLARLVPALAPFL